MIGCDNLLETLCDPSVLDISQKLVLESLGLSFGDAPGAFVAAEASSSTDTARPFDILLAHPAVGVLAIEIKAWSPSFVDHVEGGCFFLRGVARAKNPLEQAKRAMFSLQNTFDKSRGRVARPLFLSMVALLNLSEHSEAGTGVPGEYYLFSEDLADPWRLRAKIEQRVASQLQAARQSVPLTPEGLALIRGLLGNRVLLNQHRGDRDVKLGTLGALIDEWEGAERRLTQEQESISRLPVRGHPRVVRGVAGSGKSIVLTRMAARHAATFHHHQGDLGLMAWTPPRIGLICFNRSLVPFLKERLAMAYRQLTFQDLPEGAVVVKHLEGFRSMLQQEGLLPSFAHVPFEERSALQVKALSESAMDESPDCDAARFDTLFVDESQDFSPDDIRLLTQVLQRDSETGECSIILFYDDAQNIYGQPRSVWKELGIDVARKGRSQVMKVCHRNSREIVSAALNVLLGSQGNPGKRNGVRPFVGIDELLKSGMVKEHAGRGVEVHFAARSGEVPSFHVFPDQASELKHLLSEIERLLCTEGVRSSDILILFPKNHRCQAMADALLNAMVQGRLPIQGVVRCFSKLDVDGAFQREGYITVSSIHGAKGHDAAVVMLGGIEYLEDTLQYRAQFYVAATRARHSLRLSGCGTGPLLEEVHRCCEVEKLCRADS